MEGVGAAPVWADSRSVFILCPTGACDMEKIQSCGSSDMCHRSVSQSLHASAGLLARVRGVTTREVGLFKLLQGASNSRAASLKVLLLIDLIQGSVLAPSLALQSTMKISSASAT